MDLQLKDKTALVLGGGGGLGGVISRTLAAEGVRVAVADIDLAAAEKTAKAVREAGSHAIALQWDLGDLSTVDSHITRIEDELGSIDILVNNTGGPPPTPAHGQDAALWRKHFESMVLSVVSITDRVLPGMRERGFGRIITSTSSGVVSPIPNLGLSNALRMSLVGWSKTLAREVGRDGVTCNIVLPGVSPPIASASLTTPKPGAKDDQSRTLLPRALGRFRWGATASRKSTQMW